jgi:hypothetical protein
VKPPSPIAVGVRGTYRGRRFVVRGRVGLRHESGSTWDEWYAAFADGHDGWIARAEGRWLVTFADGSWLPPWDALRPGDRALPAFVVAETGTARFATKEGKLPFSPRLGRSYRYADLRGPGGAFATIDYGDDPPGLFVGHEATFEELGLEEATAPRAAPRPRRSTKSRGKRWNS